MNQEKKLNRSRASGNWLTWRKIACISLLLLAAIYIYAEPTLEQWTGIDLPSINVGGDNNQNNQAENSNESDSDSNRSNKSNSNQSASSNGGFKLETLADGSKRSPAGLVYTKNRHESRIEHVMRHAEDSPHRPIHGVFDSNNETHILKLIDEAYLLVKNNSQQVRKETSDQDPNRMEYRVDMKRRIGYVGGEVGERKNHPPANYLKLVLEGNRVITAFPDNR